MNSITIKELKNINNPIIIDVRPYEEYRYGTLQNAINIPGIKLIHKPNKYLNKQTTYYILCQSGRQSLDIVNTLNLQGFNTVNIIGGYNNYLLSK